MSADHRPERQHFPLEEIGALASDSSANHNEPAFSNLIELTSKLCEVPMVVVFVSDSTDHYYCKADNALSSAQMQHIKPFCLEAFGAKDVLVVEDLSIDSRFSANRLVTTHPALRFFTGIPLIDSDARHVGALCVFDYQPRDPSSMLLEALRLLSYQAVNQMVRRKALAEAEEQNRKLQTAEAELAARNQLLELIGQLQLGFIVDSDHHILFERMLEGLLRITESEFGFVGEVLENESSGPTLQPHAVAKLALDEPTKPYIELRQFTHPDFPNIEPLIAETLGDSRAVFMQGRIAPTAGDSRSARTFTALPVFSGMEMVGVVGLLNRTQPYDSEFADFLDPLLVTCGNIIQAFRTRSSQEEGAKKLQESEGRYDLVLRGAGIGTWDWDIRAGKVFINERSAGMLGLTAEESSLDIEAWHDLIHPDDRAKVTAATERHFAGITPIYDLEHRLRSKTGAWVWILARGKVFERGEDGNPLRALGTYLDISERKQQDQELQRAKEAAEAANLARGQFLANMSHEMRTPLTAVIGFAQALKSGEHTPEGLRDAIETILSSGEYLLEIVNDILDLSKIDAGALRIERIPMSLRDVVHEVQKITERKALEKGLALSFHVDPAVPLSVNSDPLRLRQILINLVSNAIKFTELGTIRVDLSYDPGANTYSFSVADSGIGIAADQLARIFKPFGQADSSTTRKYGGTGLGLAISAQLAKLLDGELTAASTLGVGSTFGVEFACERADTEQAPVRVPEARAVPASAALHGDILVADDVRANQKLIALHLQATSLNVVFAENGQEALDAAANRPFSAILMDVQMPVMDGLTATRLLRSRGIEIPIIAFSANAMPEDVQRCLEAGCSGHLGKPFAQEELLQILADALEGKPHGKNYAEELEYGVTVEESSANPAAIATETVSGHTVLPQPEDDEEEEEIESMRELILDWLETIPAQLQEAESALRSLQFEPARVIAHKIRGTAGLFGFAELSEVAGRLEAAAKTKDEQDAAKNFALLEHLCGLLSERFNSNLAQLY